MSNRWILLVILVATALLSMVCLCAFADWAQQFCRENGGTPRMNSNGWYCDNPSREP